MSQTFFNAVGQAFRTKYAGRIPWASMVRSLHEKGLLPDFVLEQLPEDVAPPETPAPVPPAALPVELPVVPPVPLAAIKEEEVPALESLPKQKLEDERASE